MSRDCRSDDGADPSARRIHRASSAVAAMLILVLVGVAPTADGHRATAMDRFATSMLVGVDQIAVAELPGLVEAWTGVLRGLRRDTSDPIAPRTVARGFLPPTRAPTS